MEEGLLCCCKSIVLSDFQLDFLATSEVNSLQDNPLEFHPRDKHLMELSSGIIIGSHNGPPRMYIQKVLILSQTIVYACIDLS